MRLLKGLPGLALASALSLAPAAEAAIQNPPTAVGGTNQGTLSSSIALTTVNDVAAGSLVAVALTLSSAPTTVSVSDGTNTYTRASTICTFNTANKLYLFYLPNSTHLAVGSMITASWTGTTLRASIAALSATGLATSAPLDVQATCQSGTSTTGVAISPVVTTGVMAQDNELVVGAIGLSGGFSAYAANSPFANSANVTGVTPSIALDWDIVSTGTSSGVSYAPSWTTSRLYGAGAWTFKSTSSGASCHGALLLLGVGGC